MKQVHWQLPFADTNNTQYRIDIYAEGAPVGGVKTLTGGATPFTTDEDNNDDFFTPVRSQTGCINIVDEDGTLMESGIMPKDNVDKPVRLIRVSDGSVMWQGFLSCETYSQEYTSRPNEVTLNVNSVLEAMKSNRVPETYADIRKVRGILADSFNAINFTGDPRTFIRRYYFSARAWNILDKYINTSILIEEKEIQHDNGSEIKAVCTDRKSIVEMVAKYMGLVVRECGDCIYMCCIGEDFGNYYCDYVQFVSGSGKVFENIETVSMRDLGYMGTGHEFSVGGGAKSVSVVAGIKEYNVKAESHDFPYTQDGFLYERESYVEEGGMYCLASENLQAYSDMTLGGFYSSNFQRTGEGRTAYTGGSISSSSFLGLVDGMMAATGMARPYTGAFFAKMAFDENNGTVLTHDTAEVILLGLAPSAATNTSIAQRYNPCIKLRASTQAAISSGYLQIQLNAAKYMVGVWDGESVVAHTVDSLKDYYTHDQVLSEGSLRFSLRVGDKYWDGDNEEWVDKLSVFNAPLKGSSLQANWQSHLFYTTKHDGLLVPVDDTLNGEVELCIYPVCSIGYKGDLYQVAISDLSIGFVPQTRSKQFNTDSNLYYEELVESFDDDESVEVEIASCRNNAPSPSIILNSTSSIDMMTLLTYKQSEDSQTYIRPELDLLARLAEYYKQPRTQISLEVDRPTAPLPLVRITGYDKKTYLPLSESRDWKMGVSTIRCFECPEGN